MLVKSLVFEIALLIIGIIIFIFIYRSGFHLINRVKNSAFRKGINACFLFFFILTVIISAKLFVLGIYRVPSESMENTLFPEDIILVDKLKYGAKLPRSPFEIPWVNLIFYFNDTAKKRIKENWWAYKRVSGIEKIKQGDIFVFNSVLNKNDILVKRCVALGGDTLIIKNGKVYTNNILFASFDSEKNSYKFRITNKKNYPK